jgi:hypothetical protein
MTEADRVCVYAGIRHPLGRNYWQVPKTGTVLVPGAETMDICDDCHDLWLERKAKNDSDDQHADP